MSKYIEELIFWILLGVIVASFLEISRALPLVKPSVESIVHSKVKGEF